MPRTQSQYGRRAPVIGSVLVSELSDSDRQLRQVREDPLHDLRRRFRGRGDSGCNSNARWAAFTSVGTSAFSSTGSPSSTRTNFVVASINAFAPEIATPGSVSVDAAILPRCSVMADASRNDANGMSANAVVAGATIRPDSFHRVPVAAQMRNQR